MCCGLDSYLKSSIIEEAEEGFEMCMNARSFFVFSVAPHRD